MKKAFKFALCFTLTLLFVSFSFAAFAVDVSDPAAGLKITLSDDYTVFTVDNIAENAEAASRLGLTAEDLAEQMKSSGMILVALNDKGDQVQLKKIKTDFSEDVEDLSLVTDDIISEIGNMIMSGSERVTAADGTPFFKSSGGGYGYGSVRYVTVKNGWLITLTYYGSSLSAAEAAFGGLSFGAEGGRYSVIDIILFIIMIAVMIAALVVIIYVIYTFIRDARTSDNDVAPYIRIKRRKF